MRAAAAEPIHLQLNQTSRELAVISRRFAPLPESVATYSYWDMATGTQVGKTNTCPSKRIEANAVTELDCEAKWPDKTEHGILLLRLALQGPPLPESSVQTATTTGLAHTAAIAADLAVAPLIHSTNEYWLPPPGGADVEETAWARWRMWQAESQPIINLTATATHVMLGDDTLERMGRAQIDIKLHSPCQTCPGGSLTSSGSLAVRLGLQRQKGYPSDGPTGRSEAVPNREIGEGTAGDEDTRILPAFFSDNYITLLPNETRHLTVECQREDLGGEAVELRVDGYNVRPIVVPVL